MKAKNKTPATTLKNAVIMLAGAYFYHANGFTAQFIIFVLAASLLTALYDFHVKEGKRNEYVSGHGA